MIAKGDTVLTATQPQVSVIIPTYNGHRYITRAIESILNQTYSNYEIIVVDDGSTDNTRQVLLPYLDKICYIYQANQGVGAARNRGIHEATGELVAFLDQDDYFLPHKLAAQVTLLEAQPHLGMVNSGWRIINEQDDTLYEVQFWQELPQLDVFAWVLWKPIFLGAMLFRRQWLELAGGFNTHLQQTTDIDFVLRLALLGCEADWLHQVTVCYCQHGRNASLDTLQQAKELETVLDRFFSRPNLPAKISQLEKPSRYQSLVWSAWRLYHTGYRAKMADYLEKSFRYAPGSPTETVLYWLACFRVYSSEYGSEFDVHFLSEQEEWKRLIATCVLNY